MFPLITIVVAIIALSPGSVLAYDAIVGTTSTLSQAGLRAQLVELSMIHMDNMDVPQSTPVEDGEEEEEKEKDRVGEKLVTMGHASYPGMFQHQAALLVNTSSGIFQICGAVILSNRTALTAAHCTIYFEGNQTFDHFLAVGIHNRSMGLLNPGAQIVPITHRLNHRKYCPTIPGFAHDIAILYLGEDVVENKYVQYAELATPEMGNFTHELCVVSGWGLTGDFNGLPDILQFGYQFITSHHDCVNFWAVARNNGLHKRRHICGYYYPTSSCFGDSGGPLTCGNVVAGLTSWGLGSCSGCFPEVYTRVSTYYDWVMRNM